MADGYATSDRPRWVIGSVGPGTKLPTFGHAPYAALRDAYEAQARGMIAGGADAILVETAPGPAPGEVRGRGCPARMRAAGVDLPVLVQVTVETTGTMLVGSEIGAALTALEPLGIDMIGLNCATGPAEMSEHLRHLARHAQVGVSCMPNAGLPVLRGTGALPPHSRAAGRGARHVRPRVRRSAWSAAAAARRRSTCSHVVERVAGPGIAARAPRRDAGRRRCTSTCRSARTPAYLSIGERTNANGSKAFREAMLEERWDDCVGIARDQIRDGAHMLDVCIDYVGRDGVADMREIVGRFATASTLPARPRLDRAAVVEAGLEMLGGRAVVNSVNYEDGDGPGSRIAQMMPIVKRARCRRRRADHRRGGPGAHRGVEGARSPSRLIDDLVGNWGMRAEDILVDCLTFPIATGQEETRRDAIETIEAIRRDQAELPGRPDHARRLQRLVRPQPGSARQVLNSVFLHECVKAGLDSAIVHASKIVPMTRIPDEQREAALEMVYDPSVDARATTRCARFLGLFEGVDAADVARPAPRSCPACRSRSGWAAHRRR